MDVDVLDLMEAHAEEQLVRFLDAFVTASGTLDRLFKEGYSTTSSEYVAAKATLDRVGAELTGANAVYESMMTAVRVARRLRGEDPYKVDRERWKKMTMDGLRALSSRAADSAVMARAQEAFRSLGTDKPQ